MEQPLGTGRAAAAFAAHSFPRSARANRESHEMTHREFERRVKGIGKQPRRWTRAERSHPGRFGPLLRASFAILCVVVLLALTATGTRYFSFKRSATGQTTQLTEQMAVARGVVAPAAVASAAQETPQHAHLQRVASRAHRSPRHAGAAVARRSSSAALASARDHQVRLSGAVESGAAATVPDGSAANLGGTVLWVQSGIRSVFAPVFGSDAADSAAQSFAVNFAMVAAAGAFILVMLLCLGAGMALSSKMNRAQRAEA